MSTFFRTQMTGRRGNPLVLRKILPNPDLVIASTGADIGFYIVSLVGQVIINHSIFTADTVNYTPIQRSLFRLKVA